MGGYLCLGCGGSNDAHATRRLSVETVQRTRTGSTRSRQIGDLCGECAGALATMPLDKVAEALRRLIQNELIQKAKQEKMEV